MCLCDLVAYDESTKPSKHIIDDDYLVMQKATACAQ